ncbi:TPA: hypothetical protein KSL09_003275 [Clostridioides difficile]|nr:hypothetical protein [Clostridioides difficile]
MKEYKKINFDIGCSIEQVVNTLLDYDSKAIKVYGDFNGHKLYSDTVNMDEAYKKIIGHTKYDFDVMVKESIEELEEKKKIAISKIPEWIQRGHELFSKNKWNLWDNAVDARARDLYYGMEIDCILQIEEILQEETITSFKVAKLVLENQRHSGISSKVVYSMIKEFCTNGKTFIKICLK